VRGENASRGTIIGLALDDQKVKTQSDWKPRILVHDTHNGDMLPRDGLGKHGQRAVPPAPARAEAQHQSLRFRQPVVVKAGRTRDEPRCFPIGALKQRLFKRDWRHDNNCKW
jgi:hypothetical protein